MIDVLIRIGNSDKYTQKQNHVEAQGEDEQRRKASEEIHLPTP